jgi:ADP-dependent NAD(P)H-hydrate dehydratase / NAD(P)H-hydrate epimerase
MPTPDPPTLTRAEQIQRFVVTTEQMTQIESRIFAAGMPVAALMEKVGGLLTQRIQALYPQEQASVIGILVGSGHNGGDALVVARELHFRGYEVMIYQPASKLKELTAHHAQYAASLGIPFVDRVQAFDRCSLIIDGLFGFGLTRSVEGTLTDIITHLNSIPCPILSIDLPSGIHTDTGSILGAAIKATHTLCLGLWKQAFLQDEALAFTGQSELIDFDLPLADITAVIEPAPAVKRVTPEMTIATLRHPRPAMTHKYEQGHLLLVCGSRQYFGAALLAGTAARASGVGMLSIAVPESLRLTLISHIPEALAIGCEEGSHGEIARLPDEINCQKYDAIACGCGLTPHAQSVVQQILASSRPLILDADGLNILANLGVPNRQAITILTPHPGEFKRLFPEIEGDRISKVRQAAQQSGMIVLLKGARTAIAHPDGTVWVIPASTPALARGGSGDVLTGVMGGLLAQGIKQGTDVESIVYRAAGWHALAGILASEERSERGVDASTLVQYLISVLS